MRTLAAVLLLLSLAGCGPRPSADQAAQIRRGPKPPFPVWVALTGSSMLPKYAKAGYVEIDANYPFAKLAIGDEVCFWDYNRAGGDKFTFHRIVGKAGAYYITQGINAATNPAPDGTWLDAANYQGKATGRHSVILLPPVQDSP